MKASSRFFALRSATSCGGRSLRQHLARVHHRHAVAALGLVHEVGRQEDRDALLARQPDQQLPEAVARHRIDAGGRLVEDQHLGFVKHGDGQREPLADAQRQALGQGVGHRLQAEVGQQLLDPRLRPASSGRSNRRACSIRFCRTVSSV